jgi:hypothetical protein
MINRIVNLLLLLLFLPAAWQCTERIDVEVGSTYTRLVVEGAVTTDTTVHSVRLSLTSDYFYNQTAPPVSGASVFIDDGEHTVQLDEDPLNPGYYNTGDGYFGVPGRTYTLLISGVDVDSDGENEEYTAESVLNPVNDLDSIYARRFESFFSGYEILLWAWDPPRKDYYAFKVYRNGTLLTDTLYELIVQDDMLFNGRYTNGIASQFLSDDKGDEKAQPGDTITFEINGITGEYYTYVLESQSEIYTQTPLFSGPPANISTNLSEGAIGFFLACSVKRVSCIVVE